MKRAEQAQKRPQAERSKRGPGGSHLIGFESPYACPLGTSGESFLDWFMAHLESPRSEHESPEAFRRDFEAGLEDGRVIFIGDAPTGLFCIFWDEDRAFADDPDLDQLFAMLSAQEPVIVDAASLHAASAASLCDAPRRGSPIRSIM
ncbi:MAG TPA: hypothetical protein VGM06_19600 [Polyangiaceae bacterium]|jgi:hypothetical protein